jgi:hypothetical protein
MRSPGASAIVASQYEKSAELIVSGKHVWYTVLDLPVLVFGNLRLWLN